MHKLCFYVPESHVEIVKNAVFEQGAGKIGHYDYCCWQTLGTGQYRPLEQSNAFKGTVNTVSREPEYLVEMVCEDTVIDKVIDTLLKVHPYETPAFQAWSVRGNK